jgi:hypothetical protein
MAAAPTAAVALVLGLFGRHAGRAWHGLRSPPAARRV